jgi:hypothetical protein
MSPTFGVSVAAGSGEPFLVAQQAVWASLPMSLAVDPEATNLVAVDGQQLDWLEQVAVAVRADFAGVLLVNPSPGPPASAAREVADAADDAGVCVVVETPWASHPAVAAVAVYAAERLSDATLIDSVAVVSEVDHRTSTGVLLDHLSLLRATTGPLDAVTFRADSAHGYSLGGHRGRTTVALSAVRSSSARPSARLSVYSAAGEAHLTVTADGSAAPASVFFVDAEGESGQPTWYESAARASWRRLHGAVTAKTSTRDLLDLADDLDRLATITSRTNGL